MNRFVNRSLYRVIFVTTLLGLQNHPYILYCTAIIEIRVTHAVKMFTDYKESRVISYWIEWRMWYAWMVCTVRRGIQMLTLSNFMKHLSMILFCFLSWFQQNNHSMLGVHASAQAIIHFGKIARKHNLSGVCLDSLSR